MSLGESYKRNPRVTAMFSRSIYDQLCHIADNIDFNQPIFAGRMKRNRSLGSVVAFIVELALTDEQFIRKLRRFMINGGKHYIHHINYYDRYM